MDVFSIELRIRLNFVKTSEFRGGGRGVRPSSVHHCDLDLFGKNSLLIISVAYAHYSVTCY
jgi:hypothetical protein